MKLFSLTTLILFLSSLFPVKVEGQAVPLVVYAIKVDPPNGQACTAFNILQMNVNNGNIWSCPNNTKVWTQAIDVPGSGVTSLTVNAPLTGGTITSSGAIGCQVGSGSQAGCISAADWNTFNTKQAAGSYLTGIGAGDGTTSGAPSATLTLGTVNGTVGTFGDATHAVQVTVDGKGRITNIVSIPITGTGGITGPGTTTAGFIPVWGNTSGTSLGTGLGKTGAGADVVTAPAAGTSGNCAQWLSGNLVDSGAACGSGSGTNNWISGSGVPTASCTPGSGSYLYYDIAFTNPGTPKYSCTSTNVWSQDWTIDLTSGMTYGTSPNGIPQIAVNPSAIPFKSSANDMAGLNRYAGIAGLGSAPAIANLTGTTAVVSGSTNVAGTLTSSTTGAISFTLTWNTMTYAHRAVCRFTDETTTTDVISTVQSTPPTATTLTASGTTVSGDVISYSCLAY